jgi:sulfatase modifying factor 1
MASVLCAPAAHAAGMQRIGAFEIDRTEVTVGEFRRYAQATGFVSQAERAGGGSTYEAGWVQRRGWSWQAPYGRTGSDLEPAVHLTFDEAQGYCRWAGKRLPTDAEWMEAAYTERRTQPPAGLTPGRTYPYPTGDSPEGANCLEGCGQVRTVLTEPRQATSRGRGHALAGSTRAGVNGLHEMAANVWEWTDDGAASRERPTRGGSWWYGPAQMHREHLQSKPRDTAVVYIGFRCARSAP